MICLFFGSFNPIHWGHIGLARYAYNKLACHEVWLVLSPLNPQKLAEDQWAYEYRKTLLNKAIAPYPYMHLCSIEYNLPSPLYTWRTIQALKLLYPKKQFILLIGSDNLIKLHSWNRWEQLLDQIELYVYPRPGYPINDQNFSEIPYTLCNEAEEYDISSTQIRQGLKHSQ